jgi:hypothetical protein
MGRSDDAIGTVQRRDTIGDFVEGQPSRSERPKELESFDRARGVQPMPVCYPFRCGKHADVFVVADRRRRIRT